MAFASLRVAVTLAPPPVGNHSLLKRRGGIRVASSDLQASKKVQPPKLTNDISRRDAISCIPATLLATFLAAGPAEARSVKPETRRKIREKLDKLREKAGVPKEKAESRSDDKEKLPSSPPKFSTGSSVEATI